MNPLYIGIMSGTSLDGADAALVEFNEADGSPRLVGRHSVPYPAELRAELLRIHQPGENELDRAALLGNTLAGIYAEAASGVLAATGTTAASVRAIGCHGQTVRHRPERGYTLQLGNPALLAEHTGITVVADLRSRDVAAGGQGAPLVPAFHAARFRSQSIHRVVINLGGIANLTDLPVTGPVRGFDTGPSNMLMDLWARRHFKASHDEGGAIAATGKVLPELLAEFMAEPYLALPPPKSTGRDLFDEPWLLARGVELHEPRDVMATLAAFTAQSLAAALRAHCAGATEAYACGGGARNPHLMAQLAAALPGMRLASTEALGVDPQWVEAMAFAWLAREALAGRPGNLPEVTGARGLRVLGAIHPA